MRHSVYRVRIQGAFQKGCCYNEQALRTKLTKARNQGVSTAEWMVVEFMEIGEVAANGYYYPTRRRKKRK